jgi:HEPN domain-containing protein
MEQHTIPFCFTHNLTELLTNVVTTHPDFALIRDPLLRLNLYAVAPRYPLSATDRAEAKAAIKDMRDVRRFVRARLGLPV